MKNHSMFSFPASVRTPFRMLAAALGCAVLLASPVRAGFIITEDSRILLGEGQASLVWSGTDNVFQIADGATLTVTRFGLHTSAPGFATILPGTHVVYEPLNTTGQVVFDGIMGSGIGGVFTMGANSKLEITNGIFRNNRGGNNTSSTAISSGNGDGVSGVIHAQQATALVNLKNVIFENNGQLGNTGVMRISGTLLMEGGAMIGNYAAGDHSGVINMNGTPYISLTGVLFDSNRARTIAGGITAGAGTLLLNNVTFTNNWAGGQGGALRANPDANSILKFDMTADGGTTSYLYKGNFALNRSKTEVIASDTQVIDNAPAYAPEPKGGGFLHNSTSASIIEFAIASGVDLTIGDPDEPNKAYDSLTTNGAAPKLLKTGGGDLILNADSSYWKGSSTVSAGRMLLGNDGALLGGTVVVQSGAVFGGAGRVATMDYATDLPAAATVNVGAGGILQVGLSDRMTNGFTVTGLLNLTNATVAFTAFGGTHAAKLGVSTITDGTVTVTGSIRATGTNIINMEGFTANGVYNLGDVYNALAVNGEDTLRYAINGRVSTSNSARQSAGRVSTIDGSLQVQIVLDTARQMRWTGTDEFAAGIWDDGAENWTGVSGGSATVSRYAALDTVQFATTGTITINGGVPVSNMDVQVASDTLMFDGTGGITSAPWHSEADAEDYVRAASGKLIKSGAGTLVFNNDGRNVFHGGVEIHGGTVEIQNAAQLESASASITFVDDATLRVTNSGSTRMENDIIIGNGKTATVDAAPTGVDAPVILAGNLAGGKLVKAGAGTLGLAGANAQTATELNDGSLLLMHTEALGQGKLTVQGDNRVVGASAGVNIGNDIEFGPHNLQLCNLPTGTAAIQDTAVFSGALRGKSLTILGDAPGIVATRGSLTLAGDNALESIVVQNRAVLRAASTGALGGSAATVVVNNGGALHLATPDVAAKDVLIETGGVIGFDRPSKQMLTLSGSFVMESSSTVAILSRLTSGFTKLVHAEGGIHYDPYGTSVVDLGNNNNSSYIVYTDEQNNLMLMNMNRAGNPGKDIAVTLDAMSASVAAVYTRMSESFLLLLEDYAPGDSPERSFWVRGIGSFGSYDGDATRIGYKDTTYGFAYGFDMVISERLLLGFYGGYTDSKLKAGDHAETNADMPHLGVYGAARFGKFYLAADFFGGAVKASTVRTEDETTGRYKATVYGASAETGFIFRTWENGHFKPSVGLHWMNLDYRDQAEVGVGAMFVDDFSTDRLESVVGAQLTHTFVTAWKKPATLIVQAGWRSALQSERTKLNVRFADMYVYDDNFEVLGDEYSRDRISLGIGLRMGITDRSALTFGYECEAAKDHTRHNVNATLRWLW